VGSSTRKQLYLSNQTGYHLTEFWSNIDFNMFWRRGAPLNLSTTDSGWITWSKPPGDQVAEPSGANPIALHIRSAYSKILTDESQLELSLSFMLVVIICNITKLIIMYLVLRNRKMDFLITLGDAISSFLQQPELLTHGYCSLSYQNLLIRLGLRSPPSKDKAKLEKYQNSREVRGVWVGGRKGYISALGYKRGYLAAAL
jgi:hypothetical protein